MTAPQPEVKPVSGSNDAEETIQAIHQGRIDAIVVHGEDGPKVVLLDGASEPYRVLVERMSDGALTFDSDGTILYVNSRLTQMTGQAREDLIGKNFKDLFSSAPALGANSDPVEAHLRNENGGVPVSVWTSPITMAGVTATLATVTDLSIHQRAEQIANAERFARSILEQATDAILVLAPDGSIMHASWMAEQIAEQPPVGRRFSDVFPLEAQSSAQAGTFARFSRDTFDTMLATRPVHGVEVKLRQPTLAKRSYLLSAGPLVNDAKEPVGSIVTLTDITERKRSEEQQTMLVAELNHRVKNILAIVQSVAWQTLRKAPSLEAFEAAFAGRIKAVAIAHDVLTQTRWIGIGMQELLLAVLAPYRNAGESRVKVSGPPIMLSARTVLPLSMAVHELATNASKYGALSRAGGSINLEWRVKHADGAEGIELIWREEGGPAVEQQARSGFGTMLIRRVVEHDLDGAADLSFLPAGLRAELAFPLNREAAMPPIAVAN